MVFLLCVSLIFSDAHSVRTTSNSLAVLGTYHAVISTVELPEDVTVSIPCPAGDPGMSKIESSQNKQQIHLLGKDSEFISLSVNDALFCVQNAPSNLLVIYDTCEGASGICLASGNTVYELAPSESPILVTRSN